MQPVPDTGRRLALLVATSVYSDPDLTELRAPGQDAAELSEVLRDPRIGGFEVQTLLNAPSGEVQEGVEDFCADRHPNDQLLIYLSCHGVLDSNGRLYYTAVNTRRQRLAATAVAAAWLNERLGDSRARRQILILDCCHSGAFARGAKGDQELALRQRFEPHGRGRVVLTASRGTEYSFEGGQASGEGVPSVFTNAIVNGLRTGDADRDRDGLITVTDLYQYVYDSVRAGEPRQTPEIWTYGAEGNLLVAHSIRGAVIEPEPLPEDLRLTLESPRRRVRETAVAELADLLDAAGPGLALAARHALETIAEEDHPQVAELARIAVGAPAGGAADQVRRELTERAHREEQARQEAARREAEEKTRREAEEKTRREAEEKTRREAEEKTRREAEEKTRREAEEKTRREAEEKTRREAEEKTRREAEEKTRREAEEKTRREAEEKTRREAEEKTRREAEEKTRREAEEKTRREAEEKTRREAEEKTRREAEEKTRREAEEKTRREAEEKTRREAEEKTRREAEEKTRRDVIRREVEAGSRVDKGPPSPPAAGSEVGEEAPQPGGLRLAGRIVPRRWVFIATGAAIAVAGLLTAIIIIATQPTLPAPHVRWANTTAGVNDSSPAVVGGTVYIDGEDNGNVYALDAATGYVQWSRNADAGGGSSPAVAGATVYVGGDSGVYALDAATGNVRWRYSTGAVIYFSPAVGDGTVYVGSSDSKVYALNAATGHLRWTFPTGNFVFSSPAVVDGTVYVSDDHYVYALDAATGDVRWSRNVGAVFASPAVVGGTVYVGSEDHHVYALDAATGNVRWASPTGGKVDSSSPAVVGGTVYIGSSDGKVYALDAATGNVRWASPTGDDVGSSPAVVGGTVYIGSQDHHVYALDAATGNVRWAYPTGGEVGSSPAVVGGTVYVGGGDGKVYALATRL